MNKLALLSITALSIQAFADDEIAAIKKSSKSKDAVQEPVVNVLTSAAPKSQNGWFVFADVLYWHADVGNTDWALKSDNAPAGQISHATNHKLNFKWDWGFRLGVGVNLTHDQWDSVLYYTWFHTENSNQIGTTPAQSATPTHSNVSSGFSSARSEREIHFSMFDWELGRAYYVGKQFTLRPHAGLKGGWIHQEADQKFDYPIASQSNPASSFTTTDEENDFWGLGVSGGVCTNWRLGKVNTHQFALFADFAGALMYGHFDVTMKSVVRMTATDAIVTGVNLDGLDRNLAVPMLQAMLGFDWDTSFNQDRCHFTFRAGYEFQYWFRQNQLLNLSGQQGGGYTRLSDDLAFQGLTFDFRFDF